MNDDQFTKLFKYTQEIDRKLDTTVKSMAKKDSLARLTNTIDHFANRLDKYKDEQGVRRDAQSGRLLDWAREVSKKTGVPLPEL